MTIHRSTLRISRAAGLALAVVALIAAAPSAARAQSRPHPEHTSAAHHVAHPTPRPGITAAGVLPVAEVGKTSHEAYHAARDVPQVLDGIYCHCDCHERHPELHSLLDCFKSQMAANCGICRGAAILAARLHGEGKTLDEIRKAVDERYGS